MTRVTGESEGEYYYHCGEHTAQLHCPTCGEWIVRIGER